ATSTWRPGSGSPRTGPTSSARDGSCPLRSIGPRCRPQRHRRRRRPSRPPSRRRSQRFARRPATSRGREPPLMDGRPRVAVLGFGNQGAAQAHCLRASGWPVVVGARAGASADRARQAGFEVRMLAEAAAEAEVVAALLPDSALPEIYREVLAGVLAPGAALV